ncbi:phage antirepressor KilAC domain-containing protein [Duganella violaceipulchra]|uniref:Phage antirepressor KilAC domain-containing protein n=1 Tax=Duganella violaceipulchra TaxID=2849652 RepID=A0AA41L277_9BURK|nr:phage antirepressor KilAC domain-containing protein [Duganella violaceicalia]MBV6321943.1 phage antirepressor KilAC domain-containing protein [Duganella violaceicalia]MCP2007063.1 phage antirepressor YoqD-like protein [Duganella violaceicalia]
MRHLISTAALIMTSREISDLVESRHDNVKIAIERLAHRGVIQLPAMQDVKNGQGQTVTEYHIGKRDSYVIVAQLSPEFTARLVDRWQELEAAVIAPAAPAELSRMELIELAMAAERERLMLVAQVAADAPKVAFAEAVRNVDGLCSLEKIAKTLGWGRNRFIAALKEAKVLQASRIPYQKYIERGYFEVVEQTPWEDSKGDSHASFTTMVTGAGQVWLAKNFQHERHVAAQMAAIGTTLVAAH